MCLSFLVWNWLINGLIYNVLVLILHEGVNKIPQYSNVSISANVKFQT